MSYSLDFDGGNDIVTVNNIGTLSSLTVEFWMYNMDSGNGDRYAQMVSRGANGIGWDWAAYLIPGNTLRWVGPGVTVIDTNGIPLNTWTHIAVTCNNVQTKIYINGALIRTQSTTNAMTNQTSSVMFGNDVSMSRPYRGRLAQVRIWNIIRSDSDISTYYTANLVGNETGLIGYYKLNSTSGSTAVDTSSSARNGTLSNFLLSGTTSNWVVGGPSLGITPTIGALATIPTKTILTDVSFNIAAPTTNSSGAFTYSSSNPNVATISTNTVTIVGPGTSIITATQAADATYNAGSVSTTLTVNAILPTFGTTFTLGPKSGAYLLSDASFSLTAPTSNSSGAFSYTSDNSGVATVTTSVSMSPTLYSITNPAIPTLSLTNFPILGAMPTWEMSIRFTVTGGSGNWRALVGDMYNPVNTVRGWAVYVSDENGVFFSWNNLFWRALPGSVSFNTEYILKVTRTPTSLTMLLTTVSSGATQTAVNTAMSNTSAYVMSVNGPVTIGGWINVSGENFPGTIAYVTVINPNSSVTTNTTSNLLARYDASVAASGYTLSGSNVTQWNDLTGNGYHLTSNGTGPTATSINSVAALNFNSGLGLIRASVPLSTSITVFMAITYRSSLITDGGNFMHHGTSNELSIERYFNTSQIQFQTDNQHPAPTIITVANNTNYILVGRLNGTSREFWTYSDTVAPVYITGSSSALVAGNKTLYVGKSSGNEACNSSIGEILYYNASLSNADVSANISYLQNKWLYSRYVAWNPSSTISFVSLVSNGTANITATQDASGNYLSKSVSSLLTVGQLPTFGTFTLGPKSGAYMLADVSFSLTAPTSDSSGAFRYTSDNSAVAIISATHTTSNLLARYDASVASGYTLSGSNVTQWNDLTGNGYHLTANGTGPTLTTIKSVPAFNFNSGFGLIRASVPLSTSITVFMVARYSTNIARWGSFMHHGSRDTDWSLERNDAGSVVQLQSNNDNTFCQIAAANNTNYLWVGRITGNTRDFWMYSDTVAPIYVSSNTPAVSIASSNKTIYVGKSENNEACNSIIGEILYYNASLSNADVSANLLYLQNKWFNGVPTPTGTYVNLVANGTANITATQDVCGNYMSKSVSSLLTVSNAVTPTLGTFTVPSTKVYGDASFNITLRPTSDSSGAITYSSSNSGVATIDTSGNRINIVSAGDVSFNATQAALGRFSSATKTSNTLTVSKATPAYQPISQVSKTFGIDVSFSLSAIMIGASSTSNGAYTFSSSGATSTTILSTENMNNVTGALNHTQYQSNLKLGVGGDLVGWSESGLNHFVDLANTAGQTNTPNYAIMFWDTYTITQTTAVSDSNTLNTIYTVNFKAGPAVYYEPSQTTGATASDGIVFEILRANNTVLATNTYLPGAWAGYPTLTASSFNYTGDGTGNIRVRIKPVASGTGRFSGCVDDVVISSAVARYISISGDVATILEYTPSAITIAASQAVTSNYNAGNTTFDLLVARGTPSYQAISQVTKTVGIDASFSLSAIMTGISSSNGSYTFSSATDAISISGGIATINAYTPSAVTVTATQNEALNYNAASTTFSLLISRRTPNLSSATFTVPSSKAYGDASFSVFTRPVSDSSGAITYTSSNTSVATIDASGNFITIVGLGDVSFNAAQVETSLYNAATKTSNTLTVSKATPTLTFSSPPTTKNVTNAAFTVTANSASPVSPGAITYTSNNTALATVGLNTGIVTLLSAGTVIITAAQASTAFYNAPANATCSIVISPAGSALAGQTVSPSTNFSGVNLAGASFSGSTLTGVSFTGATLTNVDFSGANITGTDFTNANISGATNLPTFSAVQKLQLLRNINNVGIGAVQLSTVDGSTLSSVISATIPGISNLTFTVVAPTTVDVSANKLVTLTSASLGTSNIYLPVNTSDVLKINGTLYRSNGTNIVDSNNTVVNYITIDGVPFRVFAGSFVGINTLVALNAFKVNGGGLYDAMKTVYLLASGTNSGAGSALSANTIASFNSTKINGDSLYDIFNALLRSA